MTKCPRCKREKIDPDGEQAQGIIKKFMLRYLYDHNGSVPEETLYKATLQMSLNHELCFMEGNECPLNVTDEEVEATLKQMIKDGRVIENKNGSFSISKDGEKWFEGLSKDE